MPYIVETKRKSKGVASTLIIIAAMVVIGYLFLQIDRLEAEKTVAVEMLATAQADLNESLSLNRQFKQTLNYEHLFRALDLSEQQTGLLDLLNESAKQNEDSREGFYDSDAFPTRLNENR